MPKSYDASQIDFDDGPSYSADQIEFDDGTEQSKDSTIRAYAQGFLGTGQRTGFNRYNAAEELGSGTLPMLTQGIAQPLITPLAAGAGMIGGPAAALATESTLSGAAAGVGRLAQTGIQNIGSLLGSGAKFKSAGEAIQESKRESIGGALGTVGGKAIVGAAKGTYALGREMLKRGAETIGNIAEPFFERAAARTSQVMSKIGVDPSEIPIAANRIRQTLTDYSGAASDFYEKTQEKILSRSGGQRLNFYDGVKDSLNKTLNVITDPDNPYSKGEIRELESLFNDASKLTDATPKQIYFFQKELNRRLGQQIQANGQYTPLGAMLNDLHIATKDFLNTNVSEIAEANAKYAAAKSARDELSKIDNADNLATTIMGAYRNKTQTMLAIEEAKKNIPGFSGAVDDFLDTVAGPKFAPLISQQARTGLTGAMLTLPTLGAMGSPEAAIAAAKTLATIAPFGSPRLIGAGFQATDMASRGMSKAAQYVPSGASEIAEVLAKGGRLHLGRELLAEQQRKK